LIYRGSPWWCQWFNAASPSVLQIIVYILSFLHASDRKEASLVCRRWYNASQDLRFQVGLCLGSKVDSLALPGSSITEASLLTLLPCLTSLRRLDVRGLDSLFMSGAFLSREEHRRQVKLHV
ncbi:hypothetical protein XENOCAPTIV_015411, partial [Xenoophorus captivus]